MESEIINPQNVQNLVITLPMVFGFLGGLFSFGVVMWGAIHWVNKATIKSQIAPLNQTLEGINGKLSTGEETMIGITNTLANVAENLSDKIQTVDTNNKTLFELHQKSTTDNFSNLNQAIGQTNKQAERQLTFIREVNTRVLANEKQAAKNEKDVAVLAQKVKNGS